MEQALVQERPVKKHSPILCALSHLLVFGGVYLYLRLYKRFFIFLAIMVVASILPLPYFYLSYAVIVVVMIDTFLQTQGINQGKIQKEPFNNVMHVGGTLLLIALIVASFLGFTSFLIWK